MAIIQEAVMKESSVYITRMIPDKAINYLKERCRVEVNPGKRAHTRAELLEKVRGRDAVLSTMLDTIDAEVMDAAGKQCRIFANFAVGYNNVDVPEATRRGIYISNTPDVLTNATADMAFALMLAVARRIVEGDRLVRPGRFGDWDPAYMLGADVSGKIAGIVGAGRIGQAFARRARGFDMKVIYTGNSPRPEFEEAAGARFVDFETLLKEADFVSIHVPLNAATRHMFGARQFSLMKKSAILVNTSRGPVINEEELADALKSGVIYGAGLDVYEREPEVEKGLLGLANVVLSPHLGSATLETRENMGLMAARNIVAALRGEVPPQCLNPEAARK
jgi:lactate dehydrogenase-like 2-hydroxyacid dehydrogenase